MSRSSVGRRFLAFLAVFAVPWAIIRWTNPDGTTGWGAFFAYGLGGVLGPLGDRFVALPRYLSMTGPMPYWQQAWPTGAFLFACAFASAALALVGREDERVTGGLLVMAGAAAGLHALGLALSEGLFVLPVGPLACWALAAAAYRDAVQRLVFVRPKARD